MTQEMPLQRWYLENQPDKKYFAAPALHEQVSFFRDRLAPMFVGCSSLSPEFETRAVVIGRHMSKSVVFPVVELRAFGGDLRLIARGNLYDFKVSLISRIPLHLPLVELSLVSPDDPAISSCYCEGFPHSLIFGPYRDGCTACTIALGDEYRVFCAALAAEVYVSRHLVSTVLT